MNPIDPQFYAFQTHVDTYQRCVRVIESCTNIEQLNFAEKYIHVYWRFISRELQRHEISPSLGVLLTLEDLILRRYVDLGGVDELGTC